jgi:hypothetical protein
MPNKAYSRSKEDRNVVCAWFDVLLAWGNPSKLQRHSGTVTDGPSIPRSVVESPGSGNKSNEGLQLVHVSGSCFESLAAEADAPWVASDLLLPSMNWPIEVSPTGARRQMGRPPFLRRQLL